LILCFIFIAFAQYNDCEVTVGSNSFDFSPLRSQEDYTVSTSNGYSFVLNMCGPIETSYLKQQFPNASAVQEVGQNNYQAGDQMTLSWSSSTNGTQNIIIASYSSGTDGRTYKINFKCKEGAMNSGKGNPVFVSEATPKNYVFDWETTFACSGNAPHDCTVYYQNQEFDLAPLRAATDYKITSDTDGTFYINICGPLVDQTVCGSANNEDNAVACQNKNNQQTVLATADSVFFNYNNTGSDIVATYYGGFQGGEIVYTITCNQNATGPIYNNKFNNAYYFSWTSPVACNANSTFLIKRSLGRHHHHHHKKPHHA